MNKFSVITVAALGLLVACTPTKLFITSTPSLSPTTSAATSTLTVNKEVSSADQSNFTITDDAIINLTTKPIPTSSVLHSISSKACLLAQLPAIGEIPWDTRRFDWAPDDRSLAYLEPENAQIGFLTLSFSPSFEDTRRLASSVVGDISWSPDSTHIAYIALRSDDLETVMTISANGTSLRDWFPGDAARTDTGIGSKHIVSWIDNSNLLLETHCGTGCQRLWELHLQDGSLEEIYFYNEAKHYIWGSDYIFSSYQAHVVLVFGGDLQIGISSMSNRTVSWLSGDYGGPVKTIFADWSPDSSSILFLRFIQGEDGIPLQQPELWVWDVIANKEIQILPDVIAASWSKSKGMIAVLSLGEPTLGIDGNWQGTTANLEGPNLLTLSMYNIQQEKIITSSTIGKVDIGYHWPGQIQQQILKPVWSPNDEYLAYRDASGNAWIISLSDLTQYKVDTIGDTFTSFKWSSNSSKLAVSTLDQLLIFAIPCSP